MFAEIPMQPHDVFMEFGSEQAVKDADWPKGNIDHFTLAKMEQFGLKPVAPAGKRELIRRAMTWCHQ